MPNAWQNETTKDPKCGGVAGIYWWAGIDKPDDVAGGHGWPGYIAPAVAEEGVTNLFGINAPAYMNGENYNTGQIVWNNYIDGGTETDKTKNPFYDAAAQSNNSQAQLMSRHEKNARFDYVFRYGYQELFKKYYPEGKEELDAIDIKADSKTYWKSMNKLAAKYNEEDWEKLKDDDKEIQVEIALDTMEAEEDFKDTLKELFGEKYSKNFFNENNVEAPQSSEYYGLSFYFDEMVYVVDFDVKKISKNELSGKLGFAGEFYFYYGGGEYGTWPTKELNEQMKTELGEENVVSGNFTTGAYVTKTMEEIMKEYGPDHVYFRRSDIAASKPEGDTIEITFFDDILATGGTARGLAEGLNAQVVTIDGKEYKVKVKDFVFLVEIDDLPGRSRLEGIAPVKSVIHVTEG